MTESELSLASLLTKTVIPPHRVSPSASPMTGSSGVSSTPQLRDTITGASEYWIARLSLSSGGHSADPLAGDDSRGCGAVVLNDRHEFQFSKHQLQTRVRGLAARCARGLHLSF